MSFEHIEVELKQHWPWVVGGLVGVYVLMKFAGGHSAVAAPVDNTGAIASMMATGAAASAQNQNYALSQSALSAQVGAAEHQAQVAQTTAVGDVISNLGVSIGSVIAAQSMIPVQAINAASINNQQALAGAAGVAAAGIAALPGTFTSLAQMQAESHAGQLAFDSTLVDMTDSLVTFGNGALNALGSNGVGTSATAAGAASASANANAQGTAAKAGAISHTADAAGKIFGGMMMG